MPGVQASFRCEAFSEYVKSVQIFVKRICQIKGDPHCSVLSYNIKRLSRIFSPFDKLWFFLLIPKTCWNTRYDFYSCTLLENHSSLILLLQCKWTELINYSNWSDLNFSRQKLKKNACSCCSQNYIFISQLSHINYKYFFKGP